MTLKLPVAHTHSLRTLIADTEFISIAAKIRLHNDGKCSFDSICMTLHSIDIYISSGMTAGRVSQAAEVIMLSTSTNSVGNRW